MLDLAHILFTVAALLVVVGVLQPLAARLGLSHTVLLAVVGVFIGMVQAGLNHQLGRSEFEDLIGKGARMLRGNSLDDIDELAALNRDYPVFFANVYIAAVIGLVVALISDLTYTFVDPRVRLT